MSGYTPIFDTVFTGTLCGKWPDIGVWLCLLAMADKHGNVDVTPQYLSAVIGIPLDDLLDCIKRFQEPDEASRSTNDDGRRLVAIDPDRPWGWKIVNHKWYRDKARKQAWDADRTATGADADRKRQERAEASRDGVPTCPDASRRGPPSDTDTNTDTNTRERARKRATRLPDDFELTPERRAVAEAEQVPAERTFAKFCDYWRAVSGQKGRKLDWDATWRNWCRREADGSPGKPAGETDDYYRKLRAGVRADH